ncbi:MAG: hypothetical protein GPOALKHO_000332 [Sodalis sp.]|nr:MAG: hypothetical protein GPOALKHO_000332 [Sodalis sp.]
MAAAVLPRRRRRLEIDFYRLGLSEAALMILRDLAVIQRYRTGPLMFLAAHVLRCALQRWWASYLLALAIGVLRLIFRRIRRLKFCPNTGRVT